MNHTSCLCRKTDSKPVETALAAAGEGYALPALRRRVAAIARACGVAGYPWDTKPPAIREILRGIGRSSRKRSLNYISCRAGILNVNAV
jgi:hypothetical protein